MRLLNFLSSRLALSVPLAAALLVAGCGGGGSGGGGVDVPSPTTQGTVSGTVVKGPVSGATVKAFAVVAGAMGPQLAVATTDAQGAFTMSMGDYAGPVMLQMNGGTYTDEASGVGMGMAVGDVMTAVLSTMPAGSTVTGIRITPLTAMAQTMALHMAGGLTPANISASNTAVGNYFMVDDILHVVPMNPLVTGSGTGVSQATMNYGMVLAAMSQSAKNAGMPASSAFVTAMMDDASDGLMDGMASGHQIGMRGSMMSGGMMQPDAGRNGLAPAMADFMNSSLNRSGVGAANMAALMQQLRSSSALIR
jgi:hypothetical protein